MQLFQEHGFFPSTQATNLFQVTFHSIDNFIPTYNSTEPFILIANFHRHCTKTLSRQSRACS